MIENLNHGVSALTAAFADDCRGPGGFDKANGQADRIAGQRLWQRFSLQSRCRPDDVATVRRRTFNPRAGRPAVPPSGSADPRPHRPGGINDGGRGSFSRPRCAGWRWLPCRLPVHHPIRRFMCWRRYRADATRAPKVIALRAIAIAHYLERSQIVRSSEGYRMDVLSNEWWGEPLDTMMGRILVQELNQRLPGNTVYGDSGAISTPADATVEINLQRLDTRSPGCAVAGCTGRCGRSQFGIARRVIHGSAGGFIDPSLGCGDERGDRRDCRM